MGHKRINITSQRFGRWTVLGRASGNRPYWLCRCDCGRERVVAGSNLRAGITESCGCIRKEAPLGKLGREAPIAWIESHISFDGDECLPWPFVRSPHGYGMVTVKGRSTHASRYMCELVNGSPPTPRHEAAHSCGKGKQGCVNPRHLRWATHTENVGDMLIHGTRLRGERHPSAKLREADVGLIRRLLANGVSQTRIAERLYVNRATIALIALGVNWRSSPLIILIPDRWVNAFTAGIMSEAEE